MNPQDGVLTYLDFSPETSAVRLSACLYYACWVLQHCDPALCASGMILARHTSTVAITKGLLSKQGILTHDGGLSYVDVVLSMLCRVGYRKSSNSPASEWEPRRRHVHQASPVTTLAPSTPSLQLLHVNPCVGLHFESHLNLLPHRTSCMN